MRAPLPGPEKLYELAERVRVKVQRAIGTNRTYPPLSASQQQEMDGAIVMMQEAMDQVSGHVRVSIAPCCLIANRAPPLQGHILATQTIGDVYYWGKGVAIDYPRAMAAYQIAAEAGDAFSRIRSALCTSEAAVSPWTMSRHGHGSRRARLKIIPPPSAISG